MTPRRELEGVAEVEAGARVLLPSLVWYTEAEGPHHVSWESASLAQRDCARDTVAEILEAVAEVGV